MRLIDADALKDHLEDLRSYTKLGEPDAYYRGETNALKIAIKRIDHAPTIDAVPVKHGRWIDKGLEIVCSACGMQYSDELPFMSKLSTPDGGNMEGFEYCPHCSAKMDGERKDT